MKKRKRPTEQVGEASSRPEHYVDTLLGVRELIARIEGAGDELWERGRAELAQDAEFYARELRVWLCLSRLRWPTAAMLALLAQPPRDLRNVEKVVCIDDLPPAAPVGADPLHAGRVYAVRGFICEEDTEGVLLVGVSGGRLPDGRERPWNSARFRSLRDVKAAFARAGLSG